MSNQHNNMELQQIEPFYLRDALGSFAIWKKMGKKTGGIISGCFATFLSKTTLIVV